MADQKSLATVVECAQTDDVVLLALGYGTLNARAKRAAANASVVCRRHQQTTLLEAVADRLSRVELAGRWATVERPLLEHPSVLGAQAQVAARLIAARVPAAVVKARRRTARKNAKNKGYPPAPAPLTLLAWTLLSTHVPETMWHPPTVRKV